MALEVKILIPANSAWNLYNFISSLFTSLLIAEHKEIVCSPKDEYDQKLQQLECKFIELSINIKRINPLHDFLLYFNLLFSDENYKFY